MQVAKTEGFEKRAQFYAAKTYCSHFNVGEPYINLKKVIFLAITTYTLFKDKEHYKSDHKILDDQTYQNDLKDFSFTFVELPKFTKTLPDLKTIEEKWYYFLKHAEETNDIDATLASNPEIKQAYAVLERTRWTEQALMEYERIAMAVADTKGAISAAKKEGLEEGLQQGLEEGLQKGLEEGLQKGLEEGLQKGLEEGLQKGQKRQQIAMAIKLLQQRYSIEKVAELTDLDLAELADLENKETKMSEL
jgi:predicted transposase/invertase (TIGR01784 family)